MKQLPTRLPNSTPPSSSGKASASLEFGIGPDPTTEELVALLRPPTEDDPLTRVAKDLSNAPSFKRAGRRGVDLAEAVRLLN